MIRRPTRSTRDRSSAASDVYKRQGYNNALADLNAYKHMLKAMQVAGSPQRKAKLRQKLGEENDD